MYSFQVEAEPTVPSSSSMKQSVSYSFGRGKVDPNVTRNLPASTNSLTLILQLLEMVLIAARGSLPSPIEIIAAHFTGVACRLSQTACGSRFRWWCDGAIPEFLLEHSQSQQ
eukprot:Protomagalhaensia_wolfi_Nauph_80__1573@NODE_1968_length_1262_cov_14_963205_g1541_i0_p3_GENE_NODE_1968_length_1262_cov_14_963205_g1541_i0NODE_1968_length_1262_cov_14_963205_g1541_i0_p3_ORF_typecomplete_len112_score17_94_NODE_1968_length_1262_cov_14_963205_g1541_i0109444